LNLNFKIQVEPNHAERVAGLYRSYFCILQQKQYKFRFVILLSHPKKNWKRKDDKSFIAKQMSKITGKQKMGFSDILYLYPRLNFVLTT